MLNKILILICVAIVFTLGFFVATSWQEERSRRTAEAQRMESVKYYQDQMKEQQLEAQKSRLKLACDQSLIYYNMLTPAQKKSTPAPECN